MPAGRGVGADSRSVRAASGRGGGRWGYHQPLMDHEKAIQARKDLEAERRARPHVPLLQLVDEIARRHDLDAARSEWLLRSALEPAPGEEPTECPQCGGALAEAENVAGHLICPGGHLTPRRRRA